MTIADEVQAKYARDLRIAMWQCRVWGVSFEACLADARKQFNKEVREEADATPLPGSQHPA